MRRNLAEQIMMQLKVMQVDEFATIAPRNVLGVLEVSRMGAGRTFCSSKLFANDCPSRTLAALRCSPFRIVRLFMDAPAVSSDGTSGMPPVSKVESIRENVET